MTAYSLRTKYSVDTAPRVPEVWRRRHASLPDKGRENLPKADVDCQLQLGQSLDAHEACTSREVVDEAHRVHLKWDRRPTCATSILATMPQLVSQPTARPAVTRTMGRPTAWCTRTKASTRARAADSPSGGGASLK